MTVLSTGQPEEIFRMKGSTLKERGREAENFDRGGFLVRRVVTGPWSAEEEEEEEDEAEEPGTWDKRGGGSEVSGSSVSISSRRGGPVNRSSTHISE